MLTSCHFVFDHQTVIYAKQLCHINNRLQNRSAFDSMQLQIASTYRREKLTKKLHSANCFCCKMQSYGSAEWRICALQFALHLFKRIVKLL